MISNNKISHLIQSQLPSFVRDDHQKFASFLEAYYRYLEQDTKVVNRIKNLQRYQNIDLTEDEFAEKLYNTFMKYIPSNVIVDRTYLLKHIKTFYRAKGTEKATRFLMRILFSEEIDFYYPKQDILRVSDGKWYIQKSLRVTNIKIDGVVDLNTSALEKFVGTQITGQTSGASAIVERVDRYYEKGVAINELIISNVDNDFRGNETISALFNDVESTRTITADIFNQSLLSVNILASGNGYVSGTVVPIESVYGTGAVAIIGSVTTGNISSITVLYGGAGYQVDNRILVTGGGGTGANAKVRTVQSDSFYHPNSYNLMVTTIAVEANTQIGNSVYSNLNSGNANTTIANGVSYWRYSNTGPALSAMIIAGGQNYTSPPDLSIVGNSAIQQLGILGRMDIIDGGRNYKIGDNIEFINVPGGYGSGAYANVTNVDASRSNAISEVHFQLSPGHYIGGEGYDQLFLPRANVVSNTGNGANIVVTSILGYGATLTSSNSSIGAIESIIVVSGGTGYNVAPTINLTQLGDGTARANTVIIDGTFSYPGRFLNDDGMISAYNFIEDRDYYQNFSYVIKSGRSLNSYKQAMLDLTHPAGTKLFGEFVYVSLTTDILPNVVVDHSQATLIKNKTYTKTGNTINISYASHGLSANANVYLEYLSGGYANVYNGIYRVVTSAANYFSVSQNVSNTQNTTGNVYVGIIST